VKTKLVENFSIVIDLEPINIPLEQLENQEIFWEEQRNYTPLLQNEEICTINKVDTASNTWNISISKTDLKHFLYTHHHPDCDKPCKYILNDPVIITKDNFVGLGLKKDNSFNSPLNFPEDSSINVSYLNDKMSTYLESALGQNIESTVRPKILKNNRKEFFALMYEVVVNLNALEVMDLYQSQSYNLKKEGEQPIFDELVFVKLEKESLIDFMQYDNSISDHLKPILSNYSS
jgi:hypothetical protein